MEQTGNADDATTGTVSLSERDRLPLFLFSKGRMALLVAGYICLFTAQLLDRVNPLYQILGQIAYVVLSVLANGGFSRTMRCMPDNRPEWWKAGGPAPLAVRLKITGWILVFALVCWAVYYVNFQLGFGKWLIANPWVPNPFSLFLPIFILTLQVREIQKFRHFQAENSSLGNA